MSSRRRAILAVCAVLAAFELLRAGASRAQMPMEPLKESGQSVTAAYEGWFRNHDGSYTMLIGYFNRNLKEALDIPVGPNNRIEPGGPDRGQPTHFLPRRQWGVFTITVPADFGKGKLTWTLVANGQKTVVPFHLDPLWIVNPFEEPAVSNTPPTLKLEPGGPPLQGPPRGIAASYSATVSQPLGLTVWASDEPHAEPEPAALRLPPLSVTWSKFRGPGAVTFASAKPEIGKADGEASTTVTFAEPGDYVLRVQVNDSSGDGGGGSQCCWTNAHVKVSVKPAAEGR
jgi:hypothetical protein